MQKQSAKGNMTGKKKNKNKCQDHSFHTKDEIFTFLNDNKGTKGSRVQLTELQLHSSNTLIFGHCKKEFI